MADEPRVVVVIDGHCGMCARSARLLERLDRSDRVEVIASQVSGVRERFGLSVAQTDAMVWAIPDGGEPIGGARGIATTLSAARGARWPLWPWRIRGVPWLLDRIYRFVADHRGWFPADPPWCDQHPDRCAEPLQD